MSMTSANFPLDGLSKSAFLQKCSFFRSWLLWAWSSTAWQPSTFTLTPTSPLLLIRAINDSTSCLQCNHHLYVSMKQIHWISLFVPLVAIIVWGDRPICALSLYICKSVTNKKLEKRGGQQMSTSIIVCNMMWSKDKKKAMEYDTSTCMQYFATLNLFWNQCTYIMVLFATV